MESSELRSTQYWAIVVRQSDSFEYLFYVYLSRYFVCSTLSHGIRNAHFRLLARHEIILALKLQMFWEETGPFDLSNRRLLCARYQHFKKNNLVVR